MNSRNAEWISPTKSLTLAGEEVHVWRTSLTRLPAQFESLRLLLAPDEISRAQHFYFERDRQHFIIARGMLRTILGGYLKSHPAQLRFAYSEHGKPSLIDTDGSKRLRFNLAHSHELALFAVTRDREIGIDLEQIRDDVATDQLAARFFSSLELSTLNSLASEDRTQAFFNYWTCKEAYIKARGEGLSFSLDKFDVSIIPESQRAILNVHDAPMETERWSLRTLLPGDGYAGAIAVEGDDWTLQCWEG